MESFTLRAVLTSPVIMRGHCTLDAVLMAVLNTGDVSNMIKCVDDLYYASAAMRLNTGETKSVSFVSSMMTTTKGHIWAEMAQAMWIAPADLPARLPYIAPQACIILDNAHLVTGVAEEALFHLYTRLAPQGRLLLTAPTAPRDWGLALPDLLSRLQAMPIARLDPPDDDLLAGVLLKLFTDRQITAEARLIPYLLPRMERSIAAAQALVAALDARSLATHRPVTRVLAAEVLDSAAPE